MDTNPLDHSLWRQDTQAPFLPHLSIYTGRGVDRKSPSLENVRLLLRVPKTFRARPWTGGYFVSDLEGPQMRFLYRTHNSILVVPPMSHAVGTVSDEAATFLTGFLKRPSNAIMVLGSFQGIFFINENIALEDGSALSLKAVPAVGPFELQDNVVGTIWEGAPMALPCPDDKGCVGVALESLPQQAIVLYASLHSASVFAIPLGKAGIILYAGFDFDSSFSEVPPAWARVLQVAQRYISQMTSSSPRIHSPGYAAYLQQKAEDVKRSQSARAQYANFLKRANVPIVPRKAKIIKPVSKKPKDQRVTIKPVSKKPNAEAVPKKLKAKDGSKKQNAKSLSKQIRHEERKEARHQLKKELKAAEAAQKASRERARRELKAAEKEAARQASLKKQREKAARKAAREQAKLQEKQRHVEAEKARKAAEKARKAAQKKEKQHAANHATGNSQASGKSNQHPLKAVKSHKENSQVKKKSGGEKAAKSKSSGKKDAAAKAGGHAAAQINSHVELDQIHARFSQLHSQAYRFRELASSHFSHVASSLDQGDRLSAASWVELFDAAVAKAHEASSAATALSKKIVRHSVSVVSQRRRAFLAARKARRIALHQLTQARARLSRGFYDRNMGYPVSHLYAAVCDLLRFCAWLTFMSGQYFEVTGCRRCLQGAIPAVRGQLRPG